MNTYVKYCPNVFLAKCEEQHDKGDTITVTTQHGKENECIIFNLIWQKNWYYYYSIIRADGCNGQEYNKKRAERLRNSSLNAKKKSDEYLNAAQEWRDFLSLAEPIKIGHHSETKHRNLIARNAKRMDRCIEFLEKAENYETRAEFWDKKATIINLSMPESLEFFEYKVDQVKKQHQFLKDNPDKRPHSMSLQYANKAVKDTEKNYELAKRLWA